MIVSAFIMGLIGSLHCVGMCGPLALQISGAQHRLLANRLLYHTGRILTYITLGLLAASVGYAMQWSGWQGMLSIVLGILLLAGLFVVALQRWFIQRSNVWIGNIRRAVSTYMRKRSATASLITGVFNGLLPCGLVYTAMALAMVQNDWQQSMLVMIAFGVATMPALLLFTYTAVNVLRYLPFSFQTMQTVMIAITGIIMIWRGVMLETAQHVSDSVICIP